LGAGDLAGVVTLLRQRESFAGWVDGAVWHRFGSLVGRGSWLAGWRALLEYCRRLAAVNVFPSVHVPSRWRARPWGPSGARGLGRGARGPVAGKDERDDARHAAHARGLPWP